MTTLKQQNARRFSHLVQVCARMACIVVLAFGVASEALAQDDAPGDPSLEQVLEAQYEALLKQIRASMPDMSVDTPKEVSAKRAAVRQLLGQHQQQVMALAGDISVFGVDYVQFQYDTAPRLTGRVLRVGPNDVFTNIEDAIAAVQPGDTVLLADGEHMISQRTIMQMRGRPLVDVQFVGNGSEVCTLKIGYSIDGAVRVRMRGLTLDGDNNSYFDLRRDGSVQIIDCIVTNYNSGAGGSSGINGGDNTTWLFERTTFNGGPGRAGGRGRGGNAFDMRGDPMMYVRQCQFIDNSEISRTSGIETYDSCVAVDSLNHSFGVMVYGGSVVSFRENQLPSNGKTREFKLATDDRMVIDAALGENVELDAFSRRVVESLRLDRRPTYWIGLLRHSEPEVRRAAAEKVRTLLAPDDIELPEQPGDVNDLTNLNAAMEAESLFADVIEWYESVKNHLEWEDAAGRWVEKNSRVPNQTGEAR